MKKITTILLLSLSLHSFSQTTETKSENTNLAENVSVAKSLFGIQTGVVGIWVYNELRLSNKIALRSELGLDTWTTTKEDSSISHVFLIPEITLEPRFYYNLNKRKSQGKNITKNSGNYFSLRSAYYPDSFMIGNTDGITFVPELHIVPCWGMKRNLGNHFDYELGGGIGYRKDFEKANAKNSNNSDVTMHIHARIGYKF